MPLLPFEPNWSGNLIERLEWLTDILTSPTGAEQRRSLRAQPRRTLEFDIILAGTQRARFDNFVEQHGGRDFHLPRWHEAHLLDHEIEVHSNFVPAPTSGFSQLRAGDPVCLFLSDCEWQLFVVGTTGEGGFFIEGLFDRAWSEATIVYPVHLVHMTDQPLIGRLTDDKAQATVRVLVAETNWRNAAPSTLPVYRGFPLLDFPPDESEDLDYGFDRFLETLDNQTSVPAVYDSARMGFAKQGYAWRLKGFAEHTAFYDLLFRLRGRAAAIWLPSLFQDFELIDSAPEGATVLKVANSDFTATGGPRRGRQDIAIELLDGQWIYRRLTSSAVDGKNELLGLAAPLDRSVRPQDVLRISFMALSRLDQDSIEIAHRTDVAGVSIAKASFRSAPDRRVAMAGF